jgi:hypothetical protein
MARNRWFLSMECLVAHRDRQLTDALVAPPTDEPHKDDDLCVCCLDQPRDTALPGCAPAHPPVMCAACVVMLMSGAAPPACPLCRALVQ